VEILFWPAIIAVAVLAAIYPIVDGIIGAVFTALCYLAFNNPAPASGNGAGGFAQGVLGIGSGVFGVSLLIISGISALIQYVIIPYVIPAL